MTAEPTHEISEVYIADVCRRFLSNQNVSRKLPFGGRLHIERQLPFLFVYREPDDRPDEGTERLLLGEASYLRARGGRRARKSVAALVRAIAEAGANTFGAFLVVEIWSAKSLAASLPGSVIWRPRFRVLHRGDPELAGTIEQLQESLGEIEHRGQSAQVIAVRSPRVTPGGMSALSPAKGNTPSVHLIGLEVQPVYRSPAGEAYPMVLRSIHRQMSRAFKQTAFRFARTCTSHRPQHFHSMGRRALVKAAWEVDQQLAEISDSFDFLISVTPVNSHQAWSTFRHDRLQKPPHMIYRPLQIVPALLKRKLFAIPTERVEDPEVAWLFRQKQDEIDRQLTALVDRGSKRFLYSSLQLFGGVDAGLFDTAKRILRAIPARSREVSDRNYVGAEIFAARAQEELDYFRESYPEITSTVSVRSDTTGLMVSQGNLLVSTDLRIPYSRMEALIQHEVGTHVLTYWNGKAQPFRQLYAGFAGYDELQEGIAVLAEHLVGALSRPRMRLLAARVIAVRMMVDGASFVETFRALDVDHGFSQQTAFAITLRVYRGGGLTKDAAYLRGLLRLLQYLRKGGHFDPLLVGKINADHVPVIRELLRREVLKPPPLKPRYLSQPDAQARLERIAQGVDVLDLLPAPKKRRRKRRTA